jgi:hypothetical protein
MDHEYEWTKILVRLNNKEVVPAIRGLYQVWKPGFPGLCGYGTTLEEAAASLLNKHGE